MNANPIDAVDLCRRFGAVQALDKINLSVRPGRITSLLGENGAGKTTFLKIILGFLKSDFGTFHLRASRIGYVSENPVFAKGATGNDILFYTSVFHGLDQDESKKLINEYSGALDFDVGLLDRGVAAYSAGNRKKFALLQNLVISPELLIVDEPFNFLDPSGIRRVRQLFLELKNRGMAFLISSHIISEAERMTDDFVIIKRGRVAIADDYHEFKSGYRLFVFPKGSGSDMKEWRSELGLLAEKESQWEVMVDRAHAGASLSFLQRMGVAPEERDLCLETIYFFFSELDDLPMHSG